jgi:hypothetical protein
LNSQLYRYYILQRNYCWVDNQEENNRQYRCEFKTS